MAGRVAGLRGAEETGCYASPRQQYIVTNSPAVGSSGPFWLLMMRSTMKLKAALSAAIALAFAAPLALAQPGGWRTNGGAHKQYYAQNRQQLSPEQRPMPPPGYGGRMNREDRQRLRDDVRWSNREPQREYREPQREYREPQREYRDPQREYREAQRRSTETGRLTPQEREQLRRDIQEANREMPREKSRERPRR